MDEIAEGADSARLDRVLKREGRVQRLLGRDLNIEVAVFYHFAHDDLREKGA